MLKIALFGNITNRKDIEDAFTPLLRENNISFEFYDASNPPEFIKTYLFDDEIGLFIACIDNKTSYIIRGYKSPDISHLIFGCMSFPPKSDEIDKNLLKNHDLSGTCPHKEYIIKRYNTECRILHEDIEYIRAERHKTAIYLKNGHAEVLSRRIGKITSELSGKYFARCSKEYLVNVFNVHKIHKIDKDSSIIELVSGAKIPLSSISENMFFEAYSMAVPEFNKIARLKMLDE